MKLAKIAILCGLGTGLVGIGAFGRATVTSSRASAAPVAAAEERTPAHDALDDLRTAKKHLESTDKALNGHRKAALDHINDAIDHMEMGLGVKPDHDHH